MLLNYIVETHNKHCVEQYIYIQQTEFLILVLAQVAAVAN
jgi:hypothetical protein